MDTKGPITYTFDCFDYLEWTTEIIAPLLETTAPQLWRIWKVKIRNTKDLHCRSTWKALIWNWGLFQARTEARSEKWGIRENTVIYQILIHLRSWIEKLYPKIFCGVVEIDKTIISYCRLLSINSTSVLFTIEFSSNSLVIIFAQI